MKIGIYEECRNCTKDDRRYGFISYAAVCHFHRQALFPIQKIEAYASMNEMEGQLGGGFFRCHRGYLVHPIEEYKRDYPNDKHFQKFVEKSAVSSFEYLISFSDSLILGSNSVELFVEQLCNFISSLYINYTEPFRDQFEDIFNVDSNKVVSYENGGFRKHKAFPILFRVLLSENSDKNDQNLLGAKNNDSLSEKSVIVKFYTLKNQNVAVSNNKTIAAYAWVQILTIGR